jgi:hypothetical protein
MATNVPIQSVQLVSSSSTITFSSIPQSYTDLRIVISNVTNAVTDIIATFNGDSSAIYSRIYMEGSSSSAGAQNNNGTGSQWGYVPSSTTHQQSVIDLMNYSNTSTFKPMIQRATVNAFTGFAALSYRSLNAITSVTLTANASTFNAGTTVDIYGIKSGGPKAFGGDFSTTDGNYWYHVFTSTGTFVPIKALSADVLVVAGGGSQGAFYGAGGGAGGLRGLTSQSFASGTSYTCTVGAGGASTGNNTSSRGNNGTNSSIIGGALSISATGGGGGAGAYTGLPYAGGSGGGGNPYSGIMAGGAGNAGGYTPVEGYAGEQGNSASPNFGGAGGGAGQAGGTNGNGKGGDGSSAYSSWGLATGTGENVSGTVYYAGGGSGNVSPFTGGKGGGGGQTARNGFAAWVGHTNTGGGSGSAADNNGYAAGSGIIIVRYAV